MLVGTRYAVSHVSGDSNVAAVAEALDAQGRSRRMVLALSAGAVVVVGLVGYGLTRSDDTGTKTPPTIGVIQAPAEVGATQPSAPPGSATSPGTVDLPVTAPGTTDIALPSPLPATTSAP